MPAPLKRSHNGAHVSRPLRLAPRVSEPLTFREARDRLLELSDDYHGARAAFSWPRPHEFNWALEWFDAELAAGEHGAQDRAESDRRARRDADLRRTCAAKSSRLANGLRALGARRGDRLLMMLGVVPELWATMLASMKLGLVLIPAMPTLGQADIADRIDRGQAKYLVAHGADAEKFAGLGEGVERIAIGEAPAGWRSYDSLLGGRSLSSRRARPRPTTRCCSISPRARPRVRSSWCIATRAIRSGISRPCTGSGSNPATRISTYPRPAGPSTPGRAFSRPGTPARPSSRSPCASSRARRSMRWSSIRSQCSARRRPSGGC